MRIAFLTSRFPWPTRTGDQLRAAHMLSHLAPKHEVTLYSIGEPASGALAVTTVIHPLGPVQSAMNLLSGVLSGQPLQSTLFLHPKLLGTLHDAIAAGKHDLIIAQLVRTAEWLPLDCPIPAVLDMVDLISRTYQE